MDGGCGKGDVDARWKNVKALPDALSEIQAKMPKFKPGIEQPTKELPSPSTMEILRYFVGNVALMTDGDTSNQEGSLRGTVRVMTLHASKGLEFPVVFIVGCQDGLIPLIRSGNCDFDEERRLLYVGITRAEYQLYLSWAKDIKGQWQFDEQSWENKESRFLKELQLRGHGSQPFQAPWRALPEQNYNHPHRVAPPAFDPEQEPQLEPQELYDMLAPFDSSDAEEEMFGFSVGNLFNAPPVRREGTPPEGNALPWAAADGPGGVGRGGRLPQQKSSAKMPASTPTTGAAARPEGAGQRGGPASGARGSSGSAATAAPGTISGGQRARRVHVTSPPRQATATEEWGRRVPTTSPSDPANPTSSVAPPASPPFSPSRPSQNDPSSITPLSSPSTAWSSPIRSAHKTKDATTNDATRPAPASCLSSPSPSPTESTHSNTPPIRGTASPSPNSPGPSPSSSPPATTANATSTSPSTSAAVGTAASSSHSPGTAPDTRLGAPTPVNLSGCGPWEGFGIIQARRAVPMDGDDGATPPGAAVKQPEGGTDSKVDEDQRLSFPAQFVSLFYGCPPRLPLAETSASGLPATPEASPQQADSEPGTNGVTGKQAAG
mmetsp:Transcript_39277/g.111194  ORF Transcript_39277/g.111194 Transcript_39277/m.111194 type:complete len:606 (-) Transcript_39277:326-2143(-)